MRRAEHRERYRLIVVQPHREVPYDRSFTTPKEAIARVGDAIRTLARNGDVECVRLERVDTPMREDAASWTPLATWDRSVVRRVLTQAHLRDGAQRLQAPGREIEPESPTTAAVPLVRQLRSAPVVSTTPGEPLKPRQVIVSRTAERPASTATKAPNPSARPHHHFYHVGLTAGIVGAAWLVLASLATGGAFFQVLNGSAYARPAIATDIPFDAPGDSPVPVDAAAGATMRSTAGEDRSGPESWDVDRLLDRTPRAWGFGRRMLR